VLLDQDGNFIEDPIYLNGQWLRQVTGEHFWIVPEWPGVATCLACGTEGSEDEMFCAECGASTNQEHPENKGKIEILRTVPDVVGPEGLVDTPDGRNDVLKAILSILAAKAGCGKPCDRLSVVEATTLGLEEVPGVNKGFDTAAGYHVIPF